MTYKLNKTYKSPENGQVLLELLVVMAILVLLLVALVSLVILSLATIQKSRLRARAASIAQDGVERIRGKRDEDRYVNNWTSSGPTPGFKQDCPSNVRDWAYGAPAPTVNPTIFPTVSATCVDGSGENVKVMTKVGWKFSGKWHDVTLETEFGPRQKGIFR